MSSALLRAPLGVAAPRRSRRAAPPRAAPPSAEGEGEAVDRRTLLFALLAVAAVPTVKTLVKDLGVGFDEDEEAYASLPVPGPGQALATFAGGCFWCMEAPFDVLDGVLATTSGYTGGAQPRPSYGDVCTGRSGHAEAVQVLYDPGRVTYAQLLDAFWRACDPTDGDGQFVDRGNQYRPAIFTHSEAQAAEARASRDALQASGVYAGRPVVAQIQPAVTFWPAENYHQDYYSKSNRYPAYRFASGRDAYIARVWGEEYVRHEQEAAKVTAAAFQEQRRVAAEARKKAKAAGV